MDQLTIAYVLKRYPRYSETFIVNEILAHEAAGLNIRIYSLLPPEDGYFQDSISKVRAPVSYLHSSSLKALEFWSVLNRTSDVIPDLWSKLSIAKEEEPQHVYQAVLLAEEIRHRRIGSIHSHFASSATSVARMAAHFADVAYTFTAHAKDIFHESVQIDILSKKLRDASGVVTVSQYNLEYLREIYGDLARNVECIHNGVDLNVFLYDAPQTRVREILAIGRLVPKKGFADLIDACAILAARGVDFCCKIIGMGELESALLLQVDRLGLQQKVLLLGPLPQTEVMAHLRKAAVLAAPCVVGDDGNRDGLPTVLIEAMALGTPCVATDVTGIPEVISHRKTGLMVPQHDPQTLADSLQEMMCDQLLRLTTSSNARHLIEEQFDVHRNSGRLRSLILRAVSSRVPLGVY